MVTFSLKLTTEEAVNLDQVIASFITPAIKEGFLDETNYWHYYNLQDTRKQFFDKIYLAKQRKSKGVKLKLSPNHWQSMEFLFGIYGTDYDRPGSMYYMNLIRIAKFQVDPQVKGINRIQLLPHGSNG